MRTIKELMKRREHVKESILIWSEKVTPFKEEIQQLEAEIHSRLKKEGVEKVSVDGVSAWIKQDISPVIVNWDKVYSYVERKKIFGLLHKRINSATFKDLVDNGEIPDGLEVNSFEKLAFRKD